jgi:hypothetical protein
MTEMVPLIEIKAGPTIEHGPDLNVAVEKDNSERASFHPPA